MTINTYTLKDTYFIRLHIVPTNACHICHLSHTASRGMTRLSGIMPVLQVGTGKQPFYGTKTTVSCHGNRLFTMRKPPLCISLATS